MADSEQLTEPTTLIDQINRHVYLVFLNIGWPKLTHQIDDAVVSMPVGDGDVQVDAAYRNKPSWTLMPEGWKDRLIKLEGRARRTLSDASVAFATKGMCMLPVQRAPAIFNSLRNMRNELEQMREAFCREYAEILVKLKDDLGDELYAIAAKKIPLESDISSRFYMRWAIFPIGGQGNQISFPLVNARRMASTLREIYGNLDIARLSDSQRASLPTQELLAQAVEDASELVQRLSNPLQRLDDTTAEELVREARQQTDRFLRQVVNDMVAEPREELSAAISNAMSMINDPDRNVRAGTLDRVSRAITKLEGFSFLATPELLARVRECRTSLDAVGVQDLNSDRRIGAQLTEVLRATLEQTTSKTDIAAGKRQFRNIRVVQVDDDVTVGT